MTHLQQESTTHPICYDVSSTRKYDAKKQIASAVRRKRARKQGVGGKPTNVRTFTKRKRRTTRRRRPRKTR